jgi:hypothetical protein
MKTESLHALLIDRELGELPAEAVELLEAWLAAHPESTTAVTSIRRTLETTQAAVRRFPELARVESNLIAFPASRLRLLPLALAASFVVMVGAAAWLGFRAGQDNAMNVAAFVRKPQYSGTLTSAATGVAQKALKSDGPWARYALASDPRGGLTVVRRDTNLEP